MNERDNLLIELLDDNRITETEFEVLYQVNGYNIETEIYWEFNIT